jgi:hypothetical protein
MLAAASGIRVFATLPGPNFIRAHMPFYLATTIDENRLPYRCPMAKMQLIAQ